MMMNNRFNFAPNTIITLDKIYGSTTTQIAD